MGWGGHLTFHLSLEKPCKNFLRRVKGRRGEDPPPSFLSLTSPAPISTFPHFSYLHVCEDNLYCNCLQDCNRWEHRDLDTSTHQRKPSSLFLFLYYYIFA